MNLPLIDLARHLPLDATHPLAAGTRRAHVTSYGLAAFSTRERDAGLPKVAVYDSEERIHLSVWLQDGPMIKAKMEVAARAMLAGSTPSDTWECAYGNRSHHVGLLVRPQTLLEISPEDGCRFIRHLRSGGYLISAATNADTLRAAHELDLVLHAEQASALLKEAKSLELLAQVLQFGVSQRAELTTGEIERLQQARSMI